MWPSRAYILKPLTDLTGSPKRTKLNWTSALQNAFDKMRYLMAADAFSGYPGHNKHFDIYTDTSDFQHAACLM